MQYLQFFEIIKNSIQSGYDAAITELGNIPEEVSQSLELTLELTMTKLADFQNEVSQKSE